MSVKGFGLEKGFGLRTSGEDFWAFSLPRGPIVVPFWDYLIKILNMKPKKELLWGLRVVVWS